MTGAAARAKGVGLLPFGVPFVAGLAAVGGIFAAEEGDESGLIILGCWAGERVAISP